MSLKDRIYSDIDTVFERDDQFASYHTWNGVRFKCVADEEMGLKRKNNNVTDLAWDNNSRQVMLYVNENVWPGRKIANEHGLYDNRPMKIISIGEDMGMLSILLLEYDPKAVAY